MKGSSYFFNSYNGANSPSVGIVNSIKEYEYDDSNTNSLPINGVPNSVSIIKKNGKIHQERYYDENGNPYLDIDYSDHGNPKQHPKVPHEHTWTELPNGKYKRN